MGNPADPRFRVNSDAQLVSTREDLYRQHAQWIRRQDNARIIIVCGGRDYQDRARVFAALDLAHSRKPITLIVHGACKRKGSDELSGADRWADEWAKERGVWVQPFPADWERLGPKAGPVRNQQMVDAGAHGCVALPGGSGTRDCATRCEAAGIRVWWPFGQ